MLDVGDGLTTEVVDVGWKHHAPQGDDAAAATVNAASPLIVRGVCLDDDGYTTQIQVQRHETLTRHETAAQRRRERQPGIFNTYSPVLST